MLSRGVPHYHANCAGRLLLRHKQVDGVLNRLLDSLHSVNDGKVAVSQNTEAYLHNIVAGSIVYRSSTFVDAAG